ncbi:MAG: hypothetical protein OXF93_09920 [Acidobacteria bacterium]|nr:hypothetical protein [Acidobacteriota bacterium]
MSCTRVVIEADDKRSRVGGAISAGATAYSDPAAGRRMARRASGSTTRMLRRVRNDVAELGGDFFVVVGVDRFEMHAEAYRCAE